MSSTFILTSFRVTFSGGDQSEDIGASAPSWCFKSVARRGMARRKKRQLAGFLQIRYLIRAILSGFDSCARSIFLFSLVRLSI